MPKSILISIKPRFVADILNLRKTIEIRKTAPKCDLPIDVYIYCTKEDDLLRLSRVEGDRFIIGKNFDIKDYYRLHSAYNGKGKVVAKFTLREVTQYITGNNVSKDSGYMFGDAEREGVYEKACLSERDIDRYCPDESFYAWHISDLVIFDKPKELRYFRNFNQWNGNEIDPYTMTKAPQSWGYCEEKR